MRTSKFTPEQMVHILRQGTTAASQEPTMHQLPYSSAAPLRDLARLAGLPTHLFQG